MDARGPEPDMFAFDPPDLTVEEAVRIAARHWGDEWSRATPRRLRGERSTNTQLTPDLGATSDAAPYRAGVVLQVQSASEPAEAIEMQTQALRHVERGAPEVPVGRVVPTSTGDDLAVERIGDRDHLVRMVTFLPGIDFDADEQLPREAYRSIGETVGRLSRALADFEHPAASRFMPWDIGNGLVVDTDMRRRLGPESADALAAVDERLNAALVSMTSLPHAVVHNDGHAGNLLRTDRTSHEVIGVIDFGDIVRTAVVADVANMAESFAPGHPDPIDVTALLAAGYHRHRPLSPAELAALPDLVLIRTALNVVLIEHQIRHSAHLGSRAAAALPYCIERLRTWSRLDRGAMIERIAAEVEPRP